MKNRRWGRLGAACGVTLATLALSACGSAPAAAPPATTAKPGGSAASTVSSTSASLSFAVGYPAVDASFAPLYVGISKGFFRQNGLTVHLNVLSGSGSEVGALLSGSLQAVVSEATPAMEAMAKGAPVVFVGSFGNTYPAAVVGKTSIHNLSQLAGKRLGLEHVNSLMWSAAVQALKQAHVPVSQVHFEYLGAPPVEYAGLIAGKVDAIVNTAPFVQEAIAHGYHLIADLRTIPHVSDGILVSKAFVQQHPQEVTAFLKGLMESVAWLKNPQNRAAAEQIMGQWTHVKNATLLQDDYQYDLPLWTANPVIPASALQYTAQFVSQTTHHTITPAQAVDLTLAQKLARHVP